ncbi:MAG: HNH endonuclease signature motif containing protein [Alphaproteobacteria bacterium]
MPTRAPLHRPPGYRTEAQRKQEHDQRRPSASKRGYGSKWRKARDGYLRKHPLCVHCEREGRVTAALEVDHIIPHRGDMKLFWNRQNWQGLCKTHHSIKTASEDGGFTGRPASFK